MKTIRTWQLLIVLFALAMTVSAYGSSGWKITFNVSGAGVFGNCKAGIHDEATDGLDYVYDVRAMLGNLNNTFAFCYFPHPEWNDIATDYFKEDIQAPAPGMEKQWLIEVYSNINGELTMEWPDFTQKLAGYEATLTDTDGTGEIIDMQTVSSVNFNNVANLPRHFAVTIIAPEILEPDTLWATAENLKVRLEWERIGDPAIAGYNLYRKLPNEAYRKINHRLIETDREFYIDKIQKKMMGSGETLTVLYKMETVAIDPPGYVLKESNEAEGIVQTRHGKKMHTK